MVTTIVSTPASRRSLLGTAFRFVSWIILLVIVTVTGFLWFYNAATLLSAARRNHHSGGIEAPVQGVRDCHGVPHISATKLEDLFFAQGYVTAQDRLWQMDITRRAIGGEMAEIFPASSAPPQPVSRFKLRFATPALGIL